MKDNTFLKISLAWALIGLFLLIIIAIYSKPLDLKIQDLEQNIGKTIIISGIVEKAVYKEKTSFIDLKDETGQISVVIFDNPEKKVAEGDIISVLGKVAEYKNNIEIIAKEIRCIKCGI